MDNGTAEPQRVIPEAADIRQPHTIDMATLQAGMDALSRRLSTDVVAVDPQQERIAAMVADAVAAAVVVHAESASTLAQVRTAALDAITTESSGVV